MRDAVSNLGYCVTRNLVVQIAVRVEYRELYMYLGPGDKDSIHNYCTKTSWIMAILKTKRLQEYNICITEDENFEDAR
jgi:hypothetical protein